ncbi:uncharacterized protein LOC102062690 [Zonotrichia albicollis]|uniref:uncharacterized protein LOC102062690 n=1 Tax=Zonotrichia albicollis TaxID=44394 RepID=UPI003D80F8DB
MMLLCAAGGLVCHRPEERSGAIGRVNYLPCCSELFALFPFPVNKFLSLTLNFFKCQSEDTVLGNALPCTIFRKQLEEKMSSGIRTVLLYLSLPSRPCNANAPSAEGTPQHDEANPPCRGAGPKLLAPARGKGREQKLRSWCRVPATPQTPLSPLCCSGPSSCTFWIHTRGGDIRGLRVPVPARHSPSPSLL